MSKIFLRKYDNGDPRRPYSIESNRNLGADGMEFGDVVILLPTNKCPFIFGISDKKTYAVRLSIGTIDSAKDLTKKVHEESVNYGKNLANSLRFEFVDKTGGPVEIDMGEL